MSKRTRTNKTAQQIKEEQINFLLDDVKKNLEEYKKAIDLKEKQLSDAKKLLLPDKKSYHKRVAKNKELKIYIENIKQRFAQYQQQQQAQFLEKQKRYYEPKTPKKYKKVVYEEEIDSRRRARNKNKQKRIEKRKIITFLIT